MIRLWMKAAAFPLPKPSGNFPSARHPLQQRNRRGPSSDNPRKPPGFYAAGRDNRTGGLPLKDPVRRPRQHLADGRIPPRDMRVEQQVRYPVDPVDQEKLFQSSHKFPLKQATASQLEVSPGDFHENNNYAPVRKKPKGLLSQRGNAIGP